MLGDDAHRVAGAEERRGCLKPDDAGADDEDVGFGSGGHGGDTILSLIQGDTNVRSTGGGGRDGVPGYIYLTNGTLFGCFVLRVCQVWFYVG